MNRCDLSPIENDLRHAERRHPVDFLEPVPASGDESIAQVCEVLSQTFVWIADGSSLEQIGLRATVVLYCVRADLIGNETLEQIGLRAGCTRQSVEHLVADFCDSVGWR